MMIDAGGVGLLVGIATLGGLIWKMGATTARFESAVTRLREEVDDLRSMRKTLEQLPLLAQRVEQVERVATRNTSDISELSEKRAASEAVKHWSQGEFG